MLESLSQNTFPQSKVPQSKVPQNRVRQNSAPQQPSREWLAQLNLGYALKKGRTTLVDNTHMGPLSVQRPFYPELEQDCCHTYLLHPPGGLAPGDSIDIQVELQPQASTLLTTPSAGKIYCTDSAGHPQKQVVHADIHDQACLEWLPQETIVFNGANAQLNNRFHLQGDAKLIAWDVVCLGRRASGESFDHGRYEQLIELQRDGRLLLRERNIWPGNAALLQAQWGMAGYVVSGTLFATLDLPRRQLDQWRDELKSQSIPGEWGITQKPGVLIARYLGLSAQHCRRGFEFLWQYLRPELTNKNVCTPRIWNT